MTTHEWKGQALTTSTGTTTHLNPVVIQSTGIPLVVARADGMRGVQIYEASSTEWLLASFGTVATLKSTLALSPNVDVAASQTLGSSSLRWHSLWVGTSNNKTHAAFAGSQHVTATSGLQTTNAVTSTLFTAALSDNTGAWVEVHICARDTGGVNRGMAVRRALLMRQTGGAAALVGVVDPTYTNMPAAWGGGVALTQATIGTVGNNFVVNVQGAVATTINWSCTVRYQAVSGNT